MANATTKTGIADEVVVLDSSSTDITDRLGNIIGANYIVRTPEEPQYGVNKNVRPVASTPQVAQIRGSLSVQAADFKPLQLLGTYNEKDTTSDGNNDTWEVTLDDEPATHTFKVVATDADTAELKEFAWGEAVIVVEEGNPVTIDFNRGRGLDFNFPNTTVNGYEGDEPQTYLDAVIKLNGSAIGRVRRMEIRYQRDLSAEDGIEDRASGNKRLPTELVWGQWSMTFRGSWYITDDEAWKAITGDSSKPYSIQDDISDDTITVDIGSQAGFIKLDPAVLDGTDASVDQNKERRVVDVEGHARDATIEGSL